MSRVNIAKAKAHLSELIARAEAGETIPTSRRGKPVVEIRAIEQPKKPIDIEALRALTARLRPSGQSGADLVRQMRDEARY